MRVFLPMQVPAASEAKPTAEWNTVKGGVLNRDYLYSHEPSESFSATHIRMTAAQFIGSCNILNGPRKAMLFFGRL